MRAIVTKAIKIFRLGRAKMCMYTYMHCNVHTSRWGGMYTTTPVQLRNDTPLGGIIPVRNDTPLGGCNDTPSGGEEGEEECKKCEMYVYY